jgi:hypothetical protein
MALLVIVLCFSLTSCSILSRILAERDLLKLLDFELSKWTSFKLSGKANLHYGFINVNQPFSFAMHEGRFRFDLFNTGLLAHLNETMLSVYVDQEKLQFRIPGLTSIQTVNLANSDFAYIGLLTVGLTVLLEKQRENIVRNGIASISGFDFSFSDTMQLKSIAHAGQSLNVRFDYNSDSIVSDVSVSIPVVKNLNVNIETFELSQNIIQPLR